MSFIAGLFSSLKEVKKKITLPPTDNEGEEGADGSKECPTTSDVDTDAVLNDSDYGELLEIGL